MTPKLAIVLSQMTTYSVDLPSAISLKTTLASIADSIDENIKAELQTNADTFFLWILISAFVVVLGCALEGPELIHDLWPRVFSWFTWASVESKLRFERRAKIAGLVGWLLIVSGVLGEGIFEGLQNAAESQLQSFNDILLTDARLTASTARRSAIEAAEATSGADSDAKSAQASAKRAELDARKAQKEAKVLEQKARDLKWMLEMAAWNLNPRTVGDPESLKKSLEKYAGTTVTFRSFSNDGDPYFVCLQLADIAL